MITNNGALIFGKGKMTSDSYLQMKNSLGEDTDVNVQFPARTVQPNETVTFGYVIEFN